MVLYGNVELSVCIEASILSSLSLVGFVEEIANELLDVLGLIVLLPS